MVAGLRRAESAAFDAAYNFYRPRLWSFLMRLARDRQVAEDLLQETWFRLARHATRLEENTELGGWLFTVARNLFISHRRWVWMDGDRLRELGLWPRRTEDTPFDVATGSETERRVEAAIGALPAKYREVLLLVAVEKFEPSQVATMVGLTPEAVRQRLARARAMIAERLEAKEAAPARAAAGAGGARGAQ